MKRLAAYCRISSDQSDQTNSFVSQQRYFREYIARNPDWVLQEIYADEGISGTTTKKRTQFNRMIQAARDGKIDLIVTKEVSRFARNTVDTLAYTRELRKKGVGVIFLNDNINSLEADGEFRLTIMASVAQEESRKTSDRVKWGQKRCMERGVVFGGSLLGYDVIDGKIQINPEGAKTVRAIFYKYLNGRKGSGTIAKELMKEGIPSSRGNLKWTSSSVLKILRNEKYCGDLIQQKTYTPDYLSHEKKYNKGQLDFVVLRDHHEPIIEREIWKTVQQEIARRNIGGQQKNGHGNRYPLSGKLKCAECGSSFVSRTKKNRRGESYKIWRCGKATTEGKLHTNGHGNLMGCDVGRQIREDVAMDILKRSVASIELDREGVIRNLASIVEGVLESSRDTESADLRRLTRELEGEKEKKQRVLEEFFDRTISKADFQFMNERCDRKITRIQEQIVAIEGRRKPEPQAIDTKRDIREVIRNIVTGETATDDFYGHLLHRMTIHSDGNAELSLNLLPAKWYFALDSLAEDGAQKAVQSASTVPISVSNPFNSAVGIE